jgi:hypothetical protein
MSTKGTSVTAARHLADELCGDYDIPLLVLHDFDKSGLTILKTLREDTDRYTFCNDIEVIDLGLRLADVIAEGLAGEDVAYAARPGVVRWNLHESGASSEEITYLMKQRVELNAFTAMHWLSGLRRSLMSMGLRR